MMERGEELEDTSETATVSCPHCEGVVETIMHKEVFQYGAGKYAVDIDVVLPVRRCASCDIEFLDHAAERVKQEALCRHFGVLTPWEIRDIRRGFGLSRAAFSELTGLGEATLGRWEAGALVQTLANDRYLRLLAAPGGIDRLRVVLRLTDHDRNGRKPRRAERRFRCLDDTEEIKAKGRMFRLHKEAA